MSATKAPTESKGAESTPTRTLRGGRHSPPPVILGLVGDDVLDEINRSSPVPPGSPVAETRAMPAPLTADKAADLEKKEESATRSPVTMASMAAPGTPRRKTMPISKMPGVGLAQIAKLKAKAAAAKARVRRPTQMALARWAVDERSEFSHPDPLNMCCHVDGTQLSDHGFLNCLGFMEPKSKITCVYVNDSKTQETLLPQYRQRYVVRKYEGEMMGRFPASRMEMAVVKMGGPGTTNTTARVTEHDAVCEFANKGHFQLLFVAMASRKLPTDELKLLGSSSDYSVRSALCSAVVTKFRDHDEVGKRAFVVGVDGSIHAHSALLLARRLAKKGDRVLAVHVEGEVARTSDGEDPGRVVEELKEDIETKYAKTDAKGGGGALSYHEVEPEAGKVASDAICAFAEEHDASYIVVGCDGLRQSLSGSTRLGGTRSSLSDQVVLKARCNVIVTQTHIDMEEAEGSFRIDDKAIAESRVGGTAAGGAGGAGR